MKPGRTYGRFERLKSRKQLEALFASGNNFRVYPLRVYYGYATAVEGESLLQAGVGAPVRLFKKATDRNRIKRQLREAYRLQKETLQQYCKANQRSVSLFILYTGKDLPQWQLLQDKTADVLQKLLILLHEAPATTS